MTLPRILPRESRLGIPKRIRCHAHLEWVRSHGCSVPGCQNGRPMHAHHVLGGPLAAKSLKPGDDKTISLCDLHHREVHDKGAKMFEAMHGIDMHALADEFARKSPHRKKLGVL